MLPLCLPGDKQENESNRHHPSTSGEEDEMKTRKNTAGPLTHLKVKVKVVVLHDQNAAAAYAAIDMGPGGLVTAEATGSAKREPGDTRDDMIAANLAVGRALAKLGRQLQGTGRSQVKAAAVSHGQASKDSVARRLRRDAAAGTEKLLPVSEIREQYGSDAADRAASRREPHGRHTRDGQER